MVGILFWRIPALRLNNCIHLWQSRSLANLKELFFSPLPPPLLRTFCFGDIISDRPTRERKQLGERGDNSQSKSSSSDAFSLTKCVTSSHLLSVIQTSDVRHLPGANCWREAMVGNLRQRTRSQKISFLCLALLLFSLTRQKAWPFC